MTNGTVYQFSVTATNAAGTSVPSEFSLGAIPNTPAVVTGVSVPANGLYGPGQQLDFTVSWDQPVTIEGSPRLGLVIGSTTVFATYLIVLSLVLLVAPNLLLGAFGLAPTTEVWIRVVGMLVAFLGVYYGVAARIEARAFFRATVMVRLSVPVFFLLFVLAGWAPWPLLIFAGVDAAGAVWTWAALRSEGV